MNPALIRLTTEENIDALQRALHAGVITAERFEQIAAAVLELAHLVEVGSAMREQQTTQLQ